MESSKIGASIISREAAEKRRKHYLKEKEYWERFEQKKGNHEIVRSALFQMNKLSADFLIVPRLLEEFFLLYLNKYHPSQQNLQLALSVARVFSVLVRQYYISATIFNMVASFYVSPSIWEKWHIGRKAKESGLQILKEMGVIITYRFNRNKYAPQENSRIVTMYQFNIEKINWLIGCVKTVAVYEENKREEKDAGQVYSYNYDSIMEDIFGFIGNAK